MNLHFFQHSTISGCCKHEEVMVVERNANTQEQPSPPLESSGFHWSKLILAAKKITQKLGRTEHKRSYYLNICNLCIEPTSEQWFWATGLLLFQGTKGLATGTVPKVAVLATILSCRGCRGKEISFTKGGGQNNKYIPRIRRILDCDIMLHRQFIEWTKHL